MKFYSALAMLSLLALSLLERFSRRSPDFLLAAAEIGMESAETASLTREDRIHEAGKDGAAPESRRCWRRGQRRDQLIARFRVSGSPHHRGARAAVGVQAVRRRRARRASG